MEDQHKEPKAEPTHSLKREMGLLSVVALGVGAMVGAGVFVLTGLAAGEAGPALLLAFFLNGIIALIIGGCYAELSTMMPHTGGAYVWARPALGKAWGFLTGWSSWFSQLVASGFYAVSFGSFGSELIAQLGIGGGVHPTILATVVVLLFIGINCISTQNSSIAQILMAGLQVGVIAVFIGFGLSVMLGQEAPGEPFTPFFPEGPIGLLAAMGLTFIAFEGFEIIVQSSEEVRDPSKMIPRAIAISIVAVVIIYILTAAVLLGTVNPPSGTTVYDHLASLGELGLVITAGEVMPYGTEILLVAALASTASALNATVFGSTRVALAMARNADLPARLSKVTARGAPVSALLVNGAIIMTTVVVLPIKDIAASTDIMFILVFVLVALSLLKLRKTSPERDRPFRMPFSPFLPWLVIVCGGALSLSLYHVSLAAWIVAIGWFVAGWLLRASRSAND